MLQRSIRSIGWMSSFIRAGFRQQLTYRQAMMAGGIASILYAAIRLVVIEGLYDEGEVIGGLTIEQATTWALLSGILFALVWSPWAHDFPEDIRSGAVVRDLLRPANPFLLQLSRQLGRMGALVLVRVTPVLVVAMLFLPIPAPSSVVVSLYLVASIVLMMFAGVTYSYLSGSSAFFTSDYHPCMAFSFYAMQFLSGLYVPVEFMPGLLGDIVQWGPGMAFMPAPTRILNGVDPGPTLLLQAFWTVIFCVAAYGALHLGRRKLVANGG